MPMGTVYGASQGNGDICPAFDESGVTMESDG